MVNLTTYMVATTTMVMDIHALNHASAEEIKGALKTSHVLRAEYSAPASVASASLVSADLHANNLLNDINNFLSGILNPPFPSAAPSPIPILGNSITGGSVSQAPAASSVIGSSVVSKAPASAATIKSASAGAASTAVPEKKKINRCAIYDMGGDYSESVQVVSHESNVYSALDRVSSSASPLPSASVKAILRARGAAMSAYSAANHASVSAHKASASSLAHAAPSHARLAEMPQVSEAAVLDLGDILRSYVASEIHGSISSVVSAIKSNSDKADAVKSILSGILPHPTPFPIAIPAILPIDNAVPSVSLTAAAAAKASVSDPAKSLPSSASSESSKPSASTKA